MTMRTRLKIDHPELIRKTSCGGVFGCPSWYGYENTKPKYCKLEDKTCRKCWSRQYDPKTAAL